MNEFMIDEWLESVVRIMFLRRKYEGEIGWDFRWNEIYFEFV